MVKYEYMYDPETDVTTRTQIGQYNSLESLLNRIGSKVVTASLKREILKAIEGESEAPIIKIEEDWWVQVETIQAATEERALVDGLNMALTAPGISDTAKKQTENELTQYIGTNTYDEYVIANDAKIADAVKARNLIEDGNPEDPISGAPALWLKAYRGVKTKKVRPTVPAPVLPTDIKKRLMAHERDLTVRDLNDTVADLSKMNALLMSFISTIYGTLSATAKNKIPAPEKAVIDHAVAAWPNTSTRGDRQLALEGTALVDKLYAREVAIADIVDNLSK